MLEGILSTTRNNGLFSKLVKLHPNNNYFFYLDIPFEETLKRHATKPNAHEFGEKEMREWWREKDVLGLPDEVIITPDLSEYETVDKILKITGL